MEREDGGARIEALADGSAVLAGYTTGAVLPNLRPALQTLPGGAVDGFVALLSPKGAVQWSALLGGGDVDKVTGLAVDGKGGITLAGFTASRDFPSRGDALQEGFAGGFDIFLAKFTATGACTWSGLFGGKGNDLCASVACEPTGNAIVVGGTESALALRRGRQLADASGGLTDALLARVIFDAPLANAGRDTILCAGSSVLLGGDAGGGRPPYAFRWSPETGLSDAHIQRPSAAPATGTIYVLTVIDAEGADARDTVEVRVLPAPRANAGPDATICPGDGTRIGGTATGGSGQFTYSWSPAEGVKDTDASSIVVRPRRSTTYTQTVRDRNGCVSTDSVTVLVREPVLVDAGPDRTVCAGEPTPIDVRVTGGAEPLQFHWEPSEGLSDPAARRPVLTARRSARFIVRVQDANGCKGADTLSVTVPPPPTVDAGRDQVLCAGGSATLEGNATGGKPPYRFAWNTEAGAAGATTRLAVSPTATTRYVLQVTDANGCVVRDSVTVEIVVPIVVQAGPDLDMCAGGETALRAEARGGTPPYTWVWSPVTGLSDPHSSHCMARPGKNTVYAITVTDAKGCTSTDETRVTVHAKPVLAVPARVEMCRDGSARLSATLRGGLPPFRYRWTPSTGLSADTVPDPLARPAETLQYRCTVTDAAGCSVDAPTTVVVLAPPAVDAGPEMRECLGTETTLRADVRGGRKPFTAQWTPSAGLKNPKALSTAARLSATTTFIVTVTDAAGCIGRDTVTVVVPPPPRSDAGPDRRCCSGGSVQLAGVATSGAPPYRYSWTPATGLDDAASPQPVASPAQDALYTLTVSDSGGCTASDVTRVTVLSPPRIAPTPPLTVCQGASTRAALAITGGAKPYRFAWAPPDGLNRSDGADPLIAPARSIIYTVTVTDANGCIATAQLPVTVLPAPVASAGPDITLCAGEKNAARRWNTC